MDMRRLLAPACGAALALTLVPGTAQARPGVGYRWYDSQDIEPLYEFGHGLSYTEFRYDNLRVTRHGRDGYRVRFNISNIGARAGTEIAQVYLTLPRSAGEPGKRLVGYERVDLKPGQTKRVRLTIEGDAPNHPLSYWRPSGGWTTPRGTYTVQVGSSSRDLALADSITRHRRTPHSD